jgi:rubrerythrin
LEKREFLKFAGIGAIAASAGAVAEYISSPRIPRFTPTWLAEKTEQNLKNAFSGESQANIRYTLFSTTAAEEKLDNVSRLFKAIAYAEQVHARNHFENLKNLKEGAMTYGMAGFGPGDTSKNLDIAIEGETFEITQMYPAYLEKATQESSGDAERSFHFALEAEKRHVNMFKEAKGAVDSGKDINIEKIHICSVCGYTGEGEAPDICPICGAPKQKFVLFQK